ncbi:effector-associated constant component EACC1 [Streptomyces tauricus]
MQVQVSVEGMNDRAREAELRSLHSWLQSDRHTRHLAAPQLGEVDPAVPGAQGSVIDVLSLVLGSAFNAASLALSLISWRATRPQQPILTVRRTDGTTIEINTGSPEEARVLLERLGLE